MIGSFAYNVTMSLGAGAARPTLCASAIRSATRTVDRHARIVHGGPAYSGPDQATSRRADWLLPASYPVVVWLVPG